jgi:probable rRNA maturation factor
MIEYQYYTKEAIIDEPSTSKWLENVISNENCLVGEVGYIFCDDKFLLDINQRFLQHDTFTDIITFPTSFSDEVISGEIYISVERVKENAGNNNTSFDKEIHRVIVHGILHLVGYGDKDVEEKLVMRKKEDFYLSLLY